MLIEDNDILSFFPFVFWYIMVGGCQKLEMSVHLCSAPSAFDPILDCNSEPELLVAVVVVAVMVVIAKPLWEVVH